MKELPSPPELASSSATGSPPVAGVGRVGRGVGSALEVARLPWEETELARSSQQLGTVGSSILEGLFSEMVDKLR